MYDLTAFKYIFLNKALGLNQVILSAPQIHCTLFSTSLIVIWLPQVQGLTGRNNSWFKCMSTSAYDCCSAV